jgi:hypothetical protein
MLDGIIVRPSGGWARYLDRLRDTPDKWLFLAIFILGSISIVSFKAMGASKVVLIATPLTLLIGYAVIAWWMQRFRLREDRIGENCYYLGLLFTLVSLAYALYAFTTDISATQIIIANFGVALTTTIAGVTLRVLFSQLREDTVEYEREARVALADATSRLTGELRSSIEDFASFRRSMTQVLEEGMAEIATKTNTSFEANTRAITEFGQATIAKLEDSYASFSRSSTKLNQAAERAVEAMEMLIERVGKIDASPEMLSHKLDPVVGGFRELLLVATERATAQKTELSRMSKTAGAASDAAARMQQSISDLAASVERDIALLRETATAVRQVIDADVKAVHGLRADMESEIATANAMVGKLHAALISLADHITESVSVRR